MHSEVIFKARDYQEQLFLFLDELLYAAFLQKKGTDYENLSMRGLVITEKEIDQAFDSLHHVSCLPEKNRKILGEMADRLQEMELTSGEPAPFYQLCQDFSLTKLESLALLIGMAPMFHRKYEKIYGYLQDHIDILSPTRGLCISLAELLTEVEEEEKKSFLSGVGNLEFLIQAASDKYEKAEKGMAGAYRLKDRICDYLRGSMELPSCLKERCERFSFMEELRPMEIREDLLIGTCRLWEKLQQELQLLELPQACMIMLCGKHGIGKHFLLKHLAQKKQLRLLFLDISGLLYEKEETVKETIEALFVESVLLRSEVILTGADIEQEEEEGHHLRRQDKRREIFSYMENYMPYFFLLCEEKEAQMGDFRGRKICIELPALEAGEKVRLWKSFGKNYPLWSDVDLEQNGNKYILTPRGILDVLETAHLLSSIDGQEYIRQEHIRQAVKQNQQNQLGAYASLINSRFVWDDLILGEEQKRQMRMVCNQMRYRDVVGEQWGFQKKTPYGRGLSVLFYGPPGTGKTMAAQVMANELGLDLYRIDISQMVSKYIGETQKNITKLFQKAKDINAVLFFDEADSLFAKRSEAKDSHDRNANAETAHLLQKLEDYEGITILATNYLNNIDDAFKRRIKFMIHIAFPETSVRLKLWKSTLPVEACCEEELDFEFFAEHFELSGSNIKEILTNAAYLAASEHRGMKNSDLMEAVKLNFAKYGKILTKSDFGYLG